jgi:hypothetical protein
MQTSNALYVLMPRERPGAGSQIKKSQRTCQSRAARRYRLPQSLPHRHGRGGADQWLQSHFKAVQHQRRGWWRAVAALAE